MRLVPHAAASGAVGLGVWAATGDAAAVPAALAAGVLPDLDHLLDYYNWYIRRDHRRLFLLLHGWEYLVAGIAVYVAYLSEPWLLAALLGYATQIGGDQLFNHQRPFTYSLAARAALRFDRRRCSWSHPARAYEAAVGALPFGRAAARRWFQSRLFGHTGRRS